MSNLAQNNAARPSGKDRESGVQRILDENRFRSAPRPSTTSNPNALQRQHGELAPCPDRCRRVGAMLDKAMAATGRMHERSPYEAQLHLVISTLAHLHRLVTDTEGEHVVLDADGRSASSSA